MVASPLLGADATCTAIVCSDTRCALRAQPASGNKPKMPISALHLEWKRKGILFASPDMAENGCSLSYTHSLSSIVFYNAFRNVIRLFFCVVDSLW